MKQTIFQKTKAALTAVSLVLIAVAVGVTSSVQTFAAVSQTQAAPQVTFTFDDGLASSITQAAPALQKYGYSGTNYITTSCIGMTTVPNNCAADGGQSYMTWDQVATLKNTYGWEIGSHTATHPQLATDGLTRAQVASELSTSKQALIDHGYDAANMAAPYGDYNGMVLSEVAKQHTSFRGFADTGYNTYPYNRYMLRVQQVQAGVTVAQVKGYIDQAKANNAWLILVFHGIKTNPSTNPEDYEYSTANLEAIAAYVKAQNIKVTNVSNGLLNGSNGILPNSGFTSGLSQGWTTDTSANVTADNANNGDLPNPSNSIKMVASASKQVHLFAPITAIDSAKKYWLSGYANITARTSGEATLYVDEYDANGNWISGQYKQGITNDQFKDLSTVYQATSASVARIRLQVGLSTNSGITAYIDNLQAYAIEATSAPVTETNLMVNGQFDNGMTGGWSTNNTGAFSLDTANHGAASGPQNSVKLTAGTTAASLFAPKVAVDGTATYTVRANANLATLQSGELGYYVDEYDMSGNWTSGKYISGKRTAGAEDVAFSYKPTSTNVRQSSVQFILTANSGITGYLDDVRWITTNATTPPANSNLLTNGSFQAGITGGWTTDRPTNVTADATSKGDPTEQVVNSIKMVSDATATAHLFSPQVVVDPTKSYTISSYLNVTARTSGEVAYYVDEYNASGAWISGKYVTAKNIIGASTSSFTYTPTSANVAQATLQFIVSPNTGTTVYVDNVQWRAN
ncbi:MAG TPA: polysaccharide deacetylase family protein [Candidatus Saccharimonadales bacterium]|nr:polysaccharide deacetylase family protein [Candidatus Saccharimonadales bacterium]